MILVIVVMVFGVLNCGIDGFHGLFHQRLCTPGVAAKITRNAMQLRFGGTQVRHRLVQYL